MEMEYHRAEEVKKFDDSKIGVKGIVDSGSTEIPRFFIHPPENLPRKSLRSDSVAGIPVIDLSGVNSGSRAEIVKEIGDAARTWGFFQVVNHGIPVELLDSTIAGIRSFNDLPAEAKSSFYGRDVSVGVSFFTNIDLFMSKAASWRDTLQIQMSPNRPEPEKIPVICRREVLEFDEKAKGLAETLMGVLSESLGLESERLKTLTCLDARMMVGHYYPYCPQPESTVGIASHKDPGVLTVLLENHIGGLHVKKGDEWVDVKPVPGSLVINVGDLLQIMSNGEYKSVDHCVLANPFREPRVSIAIFYNPGKRGDSIFYGPLPELLSLEKPAIYRNFTMAEYMGKFFNKELGKTLVDAFKL